MIKTKYRDYATAAFREWALWGCPVGTGMPSGSDELSKAKRADMKACGMCMQTLTKTGRGDICEAVKAVYMERPGEKLTRGELSARVVKFSLCRYVAERQVYEWLNVACREFARIRGISYD